MYIVEFIVEDVDTLQSIRTYLTQNHSPSVTVSIVQDIADSKVIVASAIGNEITEKADIKSLASAISELGYAVRIVFCDKNE